LAAAAIASAVTAVAVRAAAVMAVAALARRWRRCWAWRVDGWAVVERVEGRVAESVDERVVGRDGGGGVNEGECFSVWRGGGGGGGGAPLAALAAEKTAVVKAEAALSWRRWRWRRERGAGDGGGGDHYGGDGGGGEGGGGEVGWLKSSMPNARYEQGGALA